MCCTDQLIEKSSPLDGIYYVLDGWEKFEEENYDRAHDLFSTVLLDNATEYFPDAYVGLAWNSIYKANTLQGVSNWSDRQYERDMSDEYFVLADEYINADQVICPTINVDENGNFVDLECSTLCENLLAGKTYNSSYLALEASRQFYDNGLDTTNWNTMEDYSLSTIELSDTLFLCNPQYVFDHDTTVNYNSLHFLRAQTYFRLGEFDATESELLDIDSLYLDDLDCNLSTDTIFECLNSIELEE